MGPFYPTFPYSDFTTYIISLKVSTAQREPSTRLVVQHVQTVVVIPTLRRSVHNPCHETCACPSGLLLDGNQCVDRSECGCILDNDIYISVSYLDINIRNALKIRIDTTTNTSARRVSQLKLRISNHYLYLQFQLKLLLVFCAK